MSRPALQNDETAVNNETYMPRAPSAGTSLVISISVPNPSKMNVNARIRFVSFTTPFRLSWSSDS